MNSYWNLFCFLFCFFYTQIQPQKLSEKAFWVNVEEDRLVSPDLLEGLSAKFSSKPPAKKAREGDSDKPMSKKFKELKGISTDRVSCLLSRL
jgi:diaphanous 2